MVCYSYRRDNNIVIHNLVVLLQYYSISVRNFVKCAAAIALESGGKRQVRDLEIQKNYSLHEHLCDNHILGQR